VTVLHAVAPEPEPDHPGWDGVWLVSELAEFMRCSEQALRDSIRTGAWDEAVVRVGRLVRFSGPALARKFGVPGFGEEVEIASRD
jgi:hypothetical protein